MLPIQFSFGQMHQLQQTNQKRAQSAHQPKLVYPTEIHFRIGNNLLTIKIRDCPWVSDPSATRMAALAGQITTKNDDAPSPLSSLFPSPLSHSPWLCSVTSTPTTSYPSLVWYCGIVYLVVVMVFDLIWTPLTCFCNFLRNLIPKTHSFSPPTHFFRYSPPFSLCQQSIPSPKYVNSLVDLTNDALSRHKSTWAARICFLRVSQLGHLSVLLSIWSTHFLFWLQGTLRQWRVPLRFLSQSNPLISSSPFPLFYLSTSHPFIRTNFFFNS